MKLKILIAIIAAAACAAGIAVFFCMKSVKIENPCAEIRQNGKVIKILPLSEDTEFTVTCDSGSNTIVVSNGTVRVSEADCPDKICVQTGAISGGKIPIICLPHRLEIVIVSANDIEDIDGAAY